MKLNNKNTANILKDFKNMIIRTELVPKDAVGVLALNYAIDKLYNENIVEVVRCKDCKYRREQNEGETCTCGRFLELDADEIDYIYINDDDFCKWGEKE